jgi:predicted short-subunit dehydrogenase-like oxidoreductase (DUF2520 family)
MRELERDRTPSSAALADPAALPALAIVGRGRVGSSLALAARNAALEIELIGHGELARAGEAEAALLCVPDQAIGEVAAAATSALPGLRFIGHTSGATELSSLRIPDGPPIGGFSLHPLQTVPDPRTDLTGVPCAISGSTPEATALAWSLAERLGMRPFEVPEEGRAAYHAAASIASNFLIALEEAAAELLERAGVEEPRELLAPLVLRTAANWADRGPAALTGPIARGDAATVERHLAALREAAPELLPVYEALADRTRAVAEAEAAAGGPSGSNDQPGPDGGRQ